MHGKTRLAALLLTSVLGALPASATGPYVETVLPLGSAALNDAGSVTGSFLNPAGHTRAFRWNGIAFTDLGHDAAAVQEGVGGARFERRGVVAAMPAASPWLLMAALKDGSRVTVYCGAARRSQAASHSKAARNTCGNR